MAHLNLIALTDSDCDEAIGFEGDREHWVMVIVEMSS